VTHIFLRLSAGARIWSEALSSPRCTLVSLALADCEAGDPAAFALGQVRSMNVIGVCRGRKHRGHSSNYGWSTSFKGQCKGCSRALLCAQQQQQQGGASSGEGGEVQLQRVVVQQQFQGPGARLP
jgi:hypothetical protein